MRNNFLGWLLDQLSLNTVNGIAWLVQYVSRVSIILGAINKVVTIIAHKPIYELLPFPSFIIPESFLSWGFAFFSLILSLWIIFETKRINRWLNR